MTPIATAVLRALREHADEDGVAQLTDEELGQLTRRSRRHAAQGVRELRESGQLEVVCYVGPRRARVVRLTPQPG